MTRAGKDHPEYSQERGFKVILEDIQSQFRVFGDGLQTMGNRLERVENKVDKLGDKVERLEIRVIGIEHRLTGVEHRLTGVDQRLTGVEQHVGQMAAFLKKMLPTVATKDDLKPFDRRLTALESTR